MKKIFSIIFLAINLYSLEIKNLSTINNDSLKVSFEKFNNYFFNKLCNKALRYFLPYQQFLFKKMLLINCQEVLNVKNIYVLKVVFENNMRYRIKIRARNKLGFYFFDEVWYYIDNKWYVKILMSNLPNLN